MEIHALISLSHDDQLKWLESRFETEAKAAGKDDKIVKLEGCSVYSSSTSPETRSSIRGGPAFSTSLQPC